MANVKISALTAVTAPATTDVVPIVNAGATKKVTIANLVNVVRPDISCRLQYAADQAIPTGAVTVLSWNTENFDTDTMHDPTTNPSRITIQTAGKYLVQCCINFDTNPTGYRQLLIYRNGTSSPNTIASDVKGPNTIGVGMLQSGTVVSLNVADFLEVGAYQNSGGSLNTLGTTTMNSGLGVPVFQATRLN